MAFARQRRQAALGLGDEVNRQKPRGQKQLGAGKQAARRQRGLAPATIALVQVTRADSDREMSVAARSAGTKTHSASAHFQLPQ